MLPPKDKAKELVDKFRPHANLWDCRNDCPLDEANEKQCALICVDEIIKELNIWYRGEKAEKRRLNYWIEVKNEINKL
jgi:hypothetical protein